MLLGPWVGPVALLLALLLLVTLTEAAEAALMALPAARVEGALAFATGMVARGLEAWQRAPQLGRMTLALLKVLLYLALVLHGVRAFGLGEMLSAEWYEGNFSLHTAITASVLAGALALQLFGLMLGRRRPLVFGPWALAIASPITALLASAVRLFARLPGPQRAALIAYAGPERAVLHAGGSALHSKAVPHGVFWTPDLIAACRDAAQQERLGERGHDLLASIATFSDTLIREIMVPRTAVVSVSRTASHEEINVQVLQAGHSRLPVYDETIDHIVGILYVKDLFAYEIDTKKRGEPFDITPLLRPVFYVPEVMHISALLQEFQRRKTHLAIVVDEYGGTAGVVTLEDIIEEIVGEIQDEYDVEEKQFRRLPDGKILADGRVSLWDLEKPLGIRFPEEGNFETLAGFLMSLAGHLPQVGSVLRWGPLKMVVKEADERRISMVEIEHLVGTQKPV